MNNQEKTKKKRTRRSAEKMAELVLDAERIGQAKVCQREGVAPATLELEGKIFKWRNSLIKTNEDGPQAKGRSSNCRAPERQRAPQGSTFGDEYRAKIDSKKKS